MSFARSARNSEGNRILVKSFTAECAVQWSSRASHPRKNYLLWLLTQQVYATQTVRTLKSYLEGAGGQRMQHYKSCEEPYKSGSAFMTT